MTLHEFNRKVQRVDLVQIVSEAVEQNKTTVADLNRNELLRGRDKNDQFLSPLYSQDPFFKKPGAAQRYAKWKKAISPSSDRPEDVPNLFINGKYHETIKVDVQGSTIVFSSADSNAAAIESKFSNDIYGLNKHAKEQFTPQVLYPFVTRRITSLTGLAFR